MMKKVFTAIILCVATVASAQPYPSRPIRLVLGFPPGGAADFVSRAFQEPLSRTLGQPIVVENRPGAGSSIAAEHVAKSAPDGYTLLIASPSSILVNPLITPKAGFQPLKDLVAVSKVSSSPLILAVNPGIGVNSVKELIALAKKSPGKLNFATSGNGSAPHLAAVLFQRVAGVEMVHVPYKGGAPAVQSVLAGDTQLSFATPPSVLPLVQAGRLRALAILSETRGTAMADLPTAAEAGFPQMTDDTWYGMFVPAATPRDIVDRLNQELRKTLTNPELVKRLDNVGIETRTSTPEELGRFVKSESARFGKVIKSAGIKPI